MAVELAYERISHPPSAEVREPPPGCYHRAMPNQDAGPREAGSDQDPGGGTGTATPAPSGPSSRTHLEAGGRLALPNEIRERLGWREGDALILRPQLDGTLVVKSVRDQVARVRGLYRDLAPGVDLAEEIIAERREEASREDER